MSELGDIYTAAWFEQDFAPLQPEFDVVADSLYREFVPLTVVDVGCGPGMVIDRLSMHGCVVTGIEGSEHGIAYAQPTVRRHIRLADVTKLTALPRSSLVICTELAEHLDEQHADGLVALLTSAMAPVVFTAAPPGQDGHHHVNCQEKDYWIEKFERRGMILIDAVTDRLRLRWLYLQRLSHMRANVMVFG